MLEVNCWWSVVILTYVSVVNCDSDVCFRNKRSEHRSSVSESSSSRSYVSNKGNVKSSESHLSHAGTVASATTSSKNLYQRDVVTQETEEHIARLSEPVDGYMQPLVSKDAVPPRYLTTFLSLSLSLCILFYSVIDTLSSFNMFVVIVGLCLFCFVFSLFLYDSFG